MDALLFKVTLPKTFLTVAALCMVVFSAAKADSLSGLSSSPRVLQQALATQNSLKIYDSKSVTGLNFSGGLFSGRASGIDPAATNYASNTTNSYDHGDSTAELEGDPRVHALMIDGSYDFDNDLGSGLPIHPYLSSGIGMAMYDHGSSPTVASLASPGGTVPLFRVGGGVAYKLSQQWNMSLDYKAGFTGAGNQVMSSSNQSIDMQSVNMGMHFKF
jgi:opacity protein-like surface antigen